MTGMKERLGAAPTSKVLGREITFDDILALNCVPDLAPVACSTFMAWGKLTADQQTIGGRNLDWMAIPGMTERQLLVVTVPPKDSHRKSWISVTVPGFIGCLTGMNEHGVVVAMHDVVTGKPAMDSGLCPRGIALRDLVESARPYSETRDAQAILRKRPTAVGNVVPMFFPVRPRAKGNPGVVIEYDGNSNFADRVSVGYIKGHDFTIGTNHYRIRDPEPDKCERFDKLFAELSLQENSGEKLTLEGVWSLLDAVAQPRAETPNLRTYHSVVFEPAKMMMYVAISDGDKPATQCAKMTVDAGALLKTVADEAR
jgi:hypothetical protein